MPLPGISEPNKLIPLLRMLISDQTEVFKFGVAASSPKEGVLCMSKKEKLKKKEVKSEAEADAKAENGGKAVKLEVMTGECHRDEQSETTLRLVVYGKSPAKAVACIEHLLVRGPYKVAGFKGVIIEEVADEDEEAPATATTETDTAPDAPADPAAEWNKALAAIEPAYLKGVRDLPDLASKLRAVMDFAQGKAETGAYPAALAAVKKLAELLGTGPASPSGDKTTSQATAGAKLVDEWENAFTAIEPAYLQGLRDRPDDASKLRAVMDFATGKAAAGEYSKAIEALQRLETMISDLSASPKAKESQPGVNVKAAAAKFDAAKLRTQWEAATEAAMDGVAKIEASLRSYSDPQALEAADVLSELVDQFPNSMVDALDALDKAANASDNAGISAARTKVRSSAQACITYLSDNADIIKTCEEENPFGLRLAVAGELKGALKAILQNVG